MPCELPLRAVQAPVRRPGRGPTTPPGSTRRTPSRARPEGRSTLPRANGSPSIPRRDRIPCEELHELFRRDVIAAPQRPAHTLPNLLTRGYRPVVNGPESDPEPPPRNPVQATGHATPPGIASAGPGGGSGPGPGWPDRDHGRAAGRAANGSGSAATRGADQVEDGEISNLVVKVGDRRDAYRTVWGQAARSPKPEPPPRRMVTRRRVRCAKRCRRGCRARSPRPPRRRRAP